MPPSSFRRMLRLNSWTVLAPSFRSAHNHYSNDHLLPLYMNASCFEIETVRFNSKNNSSSLLKPFLSYFQAALTLFQIMFPSPSSQDPPPFFGAAMVLAFAASLSGNFLSQSKPRLAAIVERSGFFCFTMGIFVMMTKAFLAGSLVFRVTGWLAGAFLMLAFLISSVA